MAHNVGFNGELYCKVDGNVTTVANEISGLKSTVVDGKQSVANAINGKLGTSLSNQTSFSDMAYYINNIPSLGAVGSLPTTHNLITGNFPFVREILATNALALNQTVTIDGGLIMFVHDNNYEALNITPVSAAIKVYKYDGTSPLTVNAGSSFNTNCVECFIFNPSRTQLSCIRAGLSTSTVQQHSPAISIRIS